MTTICERCGYIRDRRKKVCEDVDCPHKVVAGYAPKNQNQIRLAVQLARNKLSRAQLGLKLAVAELRVQQAMCDHPGIDYTVHVPSGRVCPDCGKVVR